MGGLETTVESVATQQHRAHDQSATPSTHTAPEGTGRLPDYREPPLGYFEGDPGVLSDQVHAPVDQLPGSGRSSPLF